MARRGCKTFTRSHNPDSFARYGPILTKKPTKTSARKPAAKAKSPAGAAKTARRGEPEDAAAAQQAQMWLLREEGHSLRRIAADVGCHPRTVSREFERDPARHAALVRAQAEERAALWRQIENKALKVLSHAVDDAGRVLRTETGRVKKRFSVSDLQRVQVLRGLMGPLRMAADSATQRSQLLAGRPTEIVAGGVSLDAGSMTDEEAIMLAVHHGLEDELPAALQEKLTHMGGAEAVREV